VAEVVEQLFHGVDEAAVGAVDSKGLGVPCS
jgi:hypothetical protein